MPPLGLAGLCIVMASLALAGLTIWTARRSRRIGTFIALAATGGLLLNAVVLQDSLYVARWLPLQDVMIVGNPMLPLATVLTASVFLLVQSPLWQRSLLAMSVVGIAGWRVVNPLIRPAPQLGEARWTSGVCRQSTLSSCSPAAATTALHNVGIETSEREMARLCFTSVDGTTNLGLYRGMSVMARRSSARVVPVLATADVLRVQNRRNCVFSIVSSRTSGLELQAKHSVVLFGFDDDGHADIGDPFSGRQRWSNEQFNALWPGAGIAVERIRPDHARP